MKQFNVEEYLRLKEEGKEPKIVTRDGQSARIICTDRNHKDGCVVALIKHVGMETVFTFFENGNYLCNLEDNKDLFFADLDEEPKYRPYKDAEECFRDVVKHGGGVKAKHFDEWFHIGCIGDGFVRMVAGDTNVGEKFEQFLRNNVFADDGSPCGVKED